MATLTIDLDDEASAGIQALNSQLDEMAKATENVAKTGDDLTAVQKKQITIIHEQRAGWSELAKTSINAFGDMTSSGLKYLTVLAPIAERQRVLVGIQSAFAGGQAMLAGHLGQVTAGLAAQQSAWNGLEIVGGSAIKTVLGIGPQVLGATIAWKTWEAALGSTGKKYKETVEDISGQTDKQAEAFSKFVDEADKLGVSLDDLASSKGIKDVDQYLHDTFGVDTIDVYETNLSRFNEALGGVRNELALTGQEMIGSYAAGLDIINEKYNPLPGIVKEFDATVTRWTDNSVENLGIVSSTFRSTSDGLADFYAAWTGDQQTAINLMNQSTEAYLKWDGTYNPTEKWKTETEAMRERNAEQQRMFGYFKQSEDDFARIRIMNGQIKKDEDERGDAARIASIKTQDGITHEIEAWKLKRGELAASGKLTESVAAQMLKDYDALIKQQDKLGQFEKERMKVQNDAWKIQQKHMDEELSKYDDLIARTKAVYDLDVKRIEQKNRQNRELVGTAKNQDFQTGMDAAKDMHTGEKEIAEARLKAQGQTDAAIRTELVKMDREFNERAHTLKMQQIANESKTKQDELEKERLKLEKSGIDGTEREKRLSLIQQEEDKIVFERRKKAIEEEGRFQREQNKLTIDEQRAREMDRLKAIKDATDKAKKAIGIGGAGGGGGGGGNFDAAAKDILNAQDPKKVLKQLQEDRAKQAQMEQVERDRDLWVKGNNIGMPGQKAALDKFWDNQRKAVAQARREAFDDAMNGNVGGGELMNAQNQVAQKGLANQQKQGKISGDQAKAIADIMQALTDQANINDNMQATVDQLVANAKGIKQVTKRQAENARNQQNSLE